MYTQDYDEILMPSFISTNLPYCGSTNPPKEPGQWSGWLDLIQPYIKNMAVARCPSANFQAKALCSDDAWVMSYAINHKVGGENGSAAGYGYGETRQMAGLSFPASTIWFMESTAACNDNCRISDQGGWPEAWTYPPSANQLAWDGTNGYAARHQGGGNYAFCDGHVKYMKAEMVKSQALNTTVTNGVQYNRTGSTPTFNAN
jgi:prepilin-type processing-associated H-X9-DG protein